MHRILRYFVILVASTECCDCWRWLWRIIAWTLCSNWKLFLLAPFCKFQWNIQCCTRRGYFLSSADRSMALTDPFAFNTERRDLTWCLRGKRPWPEWHYHRDWIRDEKKRFPSMDHHAVCREQQKTKQNQTNFLKPTSPKIGFVLYEENFKKFFFFWI